MLEVGFELIINDLITIECCLPKVPSEVLPGRNLSSAVTFQRDKSRSRER